MRRPLTGAVGVSAVCRDVSKSVLLHNTCHYATVGSGSRSGSRLGVVVLVVLFVSKKATLEDIYSLDQFGLSA